MDKLSGSLKKGKGKMFRKLKADEIDVRVGGVYEKGVTFLLYKDARVDMTILDETLGPYNWQRVHKEVKGNLYCGVGLSDPTGEWVWKWDCGTESFTEKEKGEASDSFKRACVNWGIGRELYTAPFVFVNCETKSKGDYKYELTQDGKRQIAGAHVTEITYNEKGEIEDLTIEGNKGILFSTKGGYKPKATTKKAQPKEELATEVEKQTFKELCRQADVDHVAIMKRAGWKEGTLLTKEQHGKALIILGEIKDAKEG